WARTPEQQLQLWEWEKRWKEGVGNLSWPRDRQTPWSGQWQSRNKKCSHFDFSTSSLYMSEKVSIVNDLKTAAVLAGSAGLLGALTVPFLLPSIFELIPALVWHVLSQLF